MEISPAESRRVSQTLLKWFNQCRRDLPWRRDRDPYRIWVSEIMLQQTQVATVIPFFERFLKAFPGIAELAAADEQEVLRLWAGLGYYRRARNLHQAARRIMSDFGGQIPTDPAALSTLPGIGRYTMGAILSQAFDQRLPILEANSQRVLSRLFGRAGDPRGSAARRWLWAAAEELLPQRHSGEFNQALMELGALLCTPTTPSCENCPLTKWCAAKRLGLQEQIPVFEEGPRAVSIQEAAVVVRHGPQALLVQRPSGGRWAGLWEFPHAPLENQETHEAAAHRLVRDLTAVEVDMGRELLTIRHSVTHHRITLLCFEAHFRGGEFRSNFYQQGKWVRLDELASFPVSSPQRRLANALESKGRQQILF